MTMVSAVAASCASRRTGAMAGAAVVAAVCAVWWWRSSGVDEDEVEYEDEACAHARLIGETPMVRLRSLEALVRSSATGDDETTSTTAQGNASSSQPCCEILAKAEQLNPGGTPKDRVALAIMADVAAERRKRKISTLVEGSSGSTAIALAPLALAAGLRFVAVVPDDVSAEKLALLRALRAEVKVVRAASISSPSHYVNEARRLAEQLPNAYFADQFDTLANVRAHYETTGPEIARHFSTKEGAPGISAFVAAAGTGGTLAGVSRYLKACNPACRIYLADPPGSALAGRVKYGVCYATEQKERDVRRHRYDTLAEGVGLDRVTANFAQAQVDDALRVSDEDALFMAHYLLRAEGLFLGPSSAVNCVAAVRVANHLVSRFRAAHEENKRPKQSGGDDDDRDHHHHPIAHTTWSLLPFFRTGGGLSHLWARLLRRRRRRRRRLAPPSKVRVVTILCDSGQRYVSRFWNRDVLDARGLPTPPDDVGELRQALLAIARLDPDEPPLR